MKKYYLILLSGLFFILHAYSASVEGKDKITVKQITGTVFHDSNKNGKIDRGEKRLRGILVSNGDTIVVTDKHGRYQLPVIAGGSVMPILPADYTLTGSKLINANFYYLGDRQEDNPTVDFPCNGRK